MTKAFGALCALVAASSVATPVLAQPKDFTVYGIMDLGVRRTSGLTDTNAPADASQTYLGSGLNSASRWGVRGLTPLGGGQSVVFELESSLDASTGTQRRNSDGTSGPYFDRASWIGIQDASGTLTIGRHSSLLADALTSIDPLDARFEDFNPNVTASALGQHGLSDQYGNSGTPGNAYRLDNSVKLTSRSGAYKSSAMYGFGEQAGDHKPLSSAGLAMSWEENGTALTGAYQNFYDNQGRKLNAWIVGTAFQSGGLRMAATASRSDADTGDGTSTVQRVYSLGGTWSATQRTDWTLAYYKVDRQRSQYSSDDGYGRLVMFGEYKIAMRTRLYAEFDLTNWNNGYQGVGNQSRARGFALGMQHRF